MAPPPESLPEQLDIELGLDEPDDERSIQERLARRLADPQAASQYELKKRSLDARRGRVRFKLHFERAAPESALPLGGDPPREVDARQGVIIVGDGPAGCSAPTSSRAAGSAAWCSTAARPCSPAGMI